MWEKVQKYGSLPSSWVSKVQKYVCVALSELMGVQSAAIQALHSHYWNIITFSQSLKCSFGNLLCQLSVNICK